MFITERCMMHLKDFVIELENLATDIKFEASLDNKNESSNLNEIELNKELISVESLIVNENDKKDYGMSEVNRRSGKCFRFFCFPI